MINGANNEETFNRRPQFHNNISTTRRKRRVTNTSGIATDKSTIDKKCYILTVKVMINCIKL